MNSGFVFDVDSTAGVKVAQSPWEFSGYSKTILEEHAERRTTSIDHKISQVRSSKNNYEPAVPIGEDYSDDDSEPEGNTLLTSRRGKARQKRAAGNLINGSAGKVVDASLSESEADDSGLADDVVQETGQWEEGSEVSDGEGGVSDSEAELDEDWEIEDDADEDEGDEEEEEGGGMGEDDDVDTEEQETLQRVQNGKDAGSSGKSVADNDSGKSTKSRRRGKLVPKVHVDYLHGEEEKKDPSKFFASSEGASFSAKTFGELNVSRPLIRACDALGYKQPTPIQAACIPLALTGRDICGSAVTGSGKTGAFALPMLERLLYRPRRIPATRCLILTPTRELAVQVHSMVQKLAQFTDISCCLVVGGLSSKVQEVALRARPDIVVATPGRMIDHLQNSHSVGLEDLSILVLDEADRLLELGFSQEVHELVRQCPKRRQTMLFSATMTEEVASLIQLSLNTPVRLSADPSTKRPSTLSEEVVKIRPTFEEDKEAVLLALCTRTFKEKVIVFSGTKVEAHRLKILFGLSGLTAAELHGNLTQAMRLDALESFRKQEVDFLIATDVAARGLDIVGVETVINFHCPRDITIYVHRVGRTARAGRKGCAVTFVTEQERSLLKAIAKRAGSKLQNRQVAPAAIYKWRQKIEEMEDGVREVAQAEREERALRKAEMEANKAQNMMEHEAEIYARPKREWFQTSKEKRSTAAAAKVTKDAIKRGEKPTTNVVSVEDADELKRKEKWKREKEKSMTRKKRRRLEAEREDAEDEQDNGLDSGAEEEMDDVKPSRKRPKKVEENGTNSTSLVEVGYRRAKAAKSVEKLVKAGKIGPQKKYKGKTDKPKPRSRKDETEELFQGDFGEDKRKSGKSGGPKKPARKPGVSKRSFKSKSRYKRR